MFSKWLAYYIFKVILLKEFLINSKDMMKSLFLRKTRNKFIILYGQFYHIPFRIYSFWKVGFIFSWTRKMNEDSHFYYKKVSLFRLERISRNIRKDFSSVILETWLHNVRQYWHWCHFNLLLKSTYFNRLYKSFVCQGEFILIFFFK